MDRAQVTLDAAEHLMQLSSAEGELAALPPVIDLLRQATSWAALALLERDAITQGDEPRLDLNGWLKVCSEHKVADGNSLWEDWLSKTPESLWASKPSSARSNELLNLTSDLVRSAHRVPTELDAIWFRRTYRVGIPLLIAVVGFAGLTYSAHRQAVARETSFPWTVSSGAGDGCTSPSQECAEVRYFFHTREENEPWIEFDVGENTKIAGVRVANRNDCPECPGRAVPLVAEISSDRENWEEIGRKQKTFDDWDLTIGKEARWLRFRALKRTFLHFRQVRIRVDR